MYLECKSLSIVTAQPNVMSLDKNNCILTAQLDSALIVLVFDTIYSKRTYKAVVFDNTINEDL